jgi:hypothetical protein
VPSSPATFETTDFTNKINVTLNTPPRVPGVAGTGLYGVVDLPTVYTGPYGLASFTVNTPTGADNIVNFEATPANVVTSLNGSTADDTTLVTGLGVPSGTTLTLNAASGSDTLTYDAGGEVPMITAGAAYGEVKITVPGAGTIDALYYENITIINLPASPQPVIGTAVAVNTVEGFQLVNQLVGTFTFPLASLFPDDTALPAGLPASDFTTTIDWGDETPTTAGTITQNSADPSVYDVTGQHTYTSPGPFTISLTVTLNAGALTGTFNNTPLNLSSSSATADGTSANVTVVDGPIAVSAFPIVGTEGLPIAAGPIATFIDGGGPDLVSGSPDYTASIVITNSSGYADTIAAASIVQVGTSAQFTVNAPAITLPEAGTYQVVVSVTDDGATPHFTASGASTATIADATLTAGPAVDFPPTAARTNFSGEVGSFTDANPTATINDFTALIDWGDGSPNSVGTISQPGGTGNPFVVSGTHSFAFSGAYTITTVVTDADGSKVTLTNTIDVEYPDIYLSGNLFTVSLDSTKTYLDITVDSVLNAFVAASVDNIYLFGNAGFDALTVDSQYGLITAPINFYASTDSLNALAVQQSGNAGPTLTNDTLSVGATYGTGIDTVTDGTNTETIMFFNLTPMFLTAPVTTLTIEPTLGASLLNGDNAITYTATPAALNLPTTFGQVSIDNFEPIVFTAADNLVINSGAGNDVINLDNPNQPAGDTAGGLKSITVTNSTLTPTDTLIVNGTPSINDDFSVVPTGAGTGTVNNTASAFVPVTFAGIASLNIVGQSADQDILRVGDTPYNDTVEYTPGATADAGTITGYASDALGTLFDYTPITFGGFSNFVLPISAVGGAQEGDDELIINGTAGNDTFDFLGSTVDPPSQIPAIIVDGHTPVYFAPATLGVNGVVLDGLGGNDTFNFTATTNELASALAVPIHVEGSGPGDVLNFTANSSAGTTVNDGTSTISSTAANSISYSGISTINVAANGGSLLLDGTSGDDAFGYTPDSTSPSAGAVTLAGPNPLLNFTGIGVAKPFTIDPLGGTNSVTINGAAGDNAFVATDGSTPTVQVNGTQALTLVTADTQALAIIGSLGDDNLEVDSTAGPFAIPITYDGGAGDNSLTLLGGTATSDTYTASSVPGSGSSVITFAGPVTQTVNFLNLSPVFDSVTAATLDVYGNNGDNAINYAEGSAASDGPLVSTWGQVAVDSFEPINFINKTALTIDGVAGSDTIDLSNPFVPTGLTSITVASSGRTISDTLVVAGVPGTEDDFGVVPTGAGAGTIVDFVPQFPDITFAGIASLDVVGQAADGDSLRVGDTPGNDTVQYSPGATADAGYITGYSSGASSFAYTPITFSGITGFVAPISSIGAQLGNDELIVNGVAGNNTFDFLGDGGGFYTGYSSILVDGHTAVRYSPITLTADGVVLDGLGGNDTFNFTPATTELASALAVPIQVEASGIGDVINFTAVSAASTVVNYGTSALTSTTANPLSFSGVVTINLAGGGGGLLVDGTSGDDSFTYAPSTASAGSVTLAGNVAPTINFTGAAAGSFTIDPLGGTNSVTVNGTAGDDDIVATTAVSPTVQVNALESLTLVAADTQALTIVSGLGNDNLEVNSTAGAFPIPMTYIGGGGFDSLSLSGGTAIADTYTASSTPGSGSSVITFAGPITQTVDFLNLSPVFDSVTAASLTVYGNNGNNAITDSEGSAVPNGPLVTTWGQVSVDSNEPINFINKTALTINGLAGNDTTTLDDPFTPTGLSSIAVISGNPADDALVVNGIAGTIDDFEVQPTGAGSGTVADTASAFVPITFSGIANLNIVGQAADGDSLAVGDTPNNDLVEYTPGVTDDAGSISGYAKGDTSFAYVPLNFSGITGTVTPISAIGAQLGEDGLTINGTTGNDIFSFSGGGVAPFPTQSSIVVDRHTPVFYSPVTMGFNGVLLNGLGGNDLYNFAASTAESALSQSVPIQIDGNGPGDTIQVAANSLASTVVDYGSYAISSTGMNNIYFRYVGTINVSANGGGLLVDGTSGDDQFSYTPASASSNAGAVALAGSNPLLNFSSIGGAGTFTIDPLGGTNSVTVYGTSSNDAIVATTAAAPTVQVNDSQALTLVAADTQALTIASGLGNDNLEVNSTAGAFPVPLTDVGGGGDDSLTLSGGTALSDTYTPGSSAGSGSSVITFAGPSVQTVDFLNLAPVFDFVTATTLTVNATNADNAINYAEGSSPLVSPSPTWGEVAVDSSEPINFINKANLVINALAGSDEINVNNPFTPTGLTSIAVNGAGPVDGDDLVVNGTTAQDAINYALGVIAGSGAVTVDALPSVSFTGIGNLSIDGQGGNDNLTIADGNGFNAVTLTPGAAVDSGGVTITRTSGAPSSGTPLSFANLGATGSFTVSNSVLDSPDTLVYNGTVSNDRFTVDATTGQISLTTSTDLTQVPVNTVGVTTLVLDGLSGHDTFNVSAPQPYTAVDLNGGPPGQSVVNLTGNATDIVATLGGSATPISGGGLGGVTLTGIGTVALDNGAGNVTFTGTVGQPDNIAVTPTGPNSAIIQDNDQGPAFSLTTGAGGSLTVGGNAGDADTVTVNGTSKNDLITVAGTGIVSDPYVEVNDGSELLVVSVTTVTSALVVNSGLGTDSVVIDSSVSAVTVPVTYVGGGGAGDSLTLTGGTALSDLYAPGSTPGSGLNTLAFTSGTETVTFANLQPVLDMVGGPLVVDGTSGNDTINYSTSPTDITYGYVSVNNAEPIEYTSKTTLTINGLGGDDTITVNNPYTPTSLTAITVNGDSTSGNVGNDTLVVNANDALFTSADINTTSTTVLAIPGAIPVPINYATIENVHIINSKDSLTGAPASAISAVANTPLNNVTVASFKFSDTQPPAEVSSPSDFLATVDWGDGTVADPDVSAGTITELAPDNGVVNFQVLGTHTYTTQGSFTVNVTVYDTGSSRTFTPTSGSVPVTITANSGALTLVTPITTTSNVYSAPITAYGTPTNQVEGISATTLVATIVDPNPGASPANYLVNGAISINWGDGTPVTDTSPPITVTQIGTQANGVVFEVFAPHTYASYGNYTVTTTIIRSTIIDDVQTPGSATVAVSNESVADAPLTAVPTQPSVNTTEAVIYPTPEFGTPLFTGYVAEFTDADPEAPISDFRALVDWGDGTPESAGTITQPMVLPGTPFFVTASHTYATSGVNGGVGHYPITVYITDVGGSKLTVFNTANVADNPIDVSGILNPATDTGKSNTDDITNDAQPNFYGTVFVAGTNTPEPYSHVVLYANGVAVGNTQAGSDGSWSINSNLLPQGTYAITAVATDQFGQTVSPTATIVQDLVVDTAPPVIAGLSFNRFNATLTLTFQDNLSGMDLASITNSAFYHISAKPLSSKVHVPKTILPTAIYYTPGAAPSDPVVVKVVFNHGHTFRGGKYEVIIDSGTGDAGIQDVAGNALDGNFYRTFPTGDGLAGGDFVAEIYTFHTVILPFVPSADGYVPPPKGIDPPAGSSSKAKRVHIKTSVIVDHTATRKLATQNERLGAYDEALRELVGETKAGKSFRTR